MSLDEPTADQTWGALPPGEMAWALEHETERHRSESVLRMRRWWTETEPDRALRVRCSARRGKQRKPCRQVVADVYDSPDGYYCRAQMMPFIEGTTTVLDAAHDHAASNRPVLARREAAEAGKRTNYDLSLHDPPPGLDGAILLGCRDHGNVAVSTDRLIAEARSTRHTFNVDTGRKSVT